MNDGSRLSWRAMVASDMPEVSRLAAEIHLDHPESDMVLIEKFNCFPKGCFVCSNGSDILGYMLSHPWKRYNPPPLDTCLEALPVNPDTYYIHDLALSSAAQGCGMARLVVEDLICLAKAVNLPVISLVAVGKSASFWKRQGFNIHQSSALIKKLRSYGSEAHYMERAL